MQVNTYPLSHTSPHTCMYTHTQSHVPMCTHTTLRSGHPPTYPLCPGLSWHQGSPEEASVTGTALGGEAAPSWCPAGRGLGGACVQAQTARTSAGVHRGSRLPGLGPAQDPYRLELPGPLHRRAHPRSARHLSSGPPVGGRPVIGLCPQAARGTEGWGRHSRWQKRKHGFSLTSLNGRRAGLCRAGWGWISHLDRTRSQGSLPHFFLEECWKFWWPGMEKENLRTLKSFTASGVEAFTQARW